MFHAIQISYNTSMDTDSKDTIEFLKEREAKLGHPLRFRTYSTWFAKLGGEKREWGVFLYSDGITMVYEDFDREPTVLGIPIKRKNKEEYIKLEASFPVKDIKDISLVPRTAAEASFKMAKDLSKSAGSFSKLLRRTVSKITLEDGTIYFMELMDHKGFIKLIKEFQKEAK